MPEGIFAVLESLERSIEGLGLTALASASGLPKATTHRLLEQLVELGAVEQHCGQYRIGPRMFRLGQAWQPHQRLHHAGKRALRNLAFVTKASAMLSVLYDNKTPDKHDHTRVRADGGRTFDRIWSNLLSILHGPYDVEVILRIHFMPDNLEAMDELVADINATFASDSRFAVHFKEVGHLGGPNDASFTVLSGQAAQDAQKQLDRKLARPEQAYPST